MCIHASCHRCTRYPPRPACHRGQTRPMSWDRDEGWTTVAGLLSPTDATALATACANALDELGADAAGGDKPAGGTQRMSRLLERVPQVASLVDRPALTAAVHQLLGNRGQLAEVAFRNPRPGFGRQFLHADDVPKL